MMIRVSVLVFVLPLVLCAQDRPSLREVREHAAKRSRYLSFKVPRLAEAPEPRLAEFRRDIEPVLRSACTECHGPDTQEAHFRIDKLNPDLLRGPDVSRWLEVLAVLTNGEMPPPDSTELTEGDRARVIEWLADEIRIASTVHRAEQGHSSFRRLSRYEHNYAIQDLLGLPYDFTRDLPPEPGSEEGFLNSSEMLHVSPVQLQTYRQLSRAALELATVRGDQPPTLYWGIPMQAVSAIAWRQQEDQIAKITRENTDDSEKLERQLARYSRRPGGVHFRDVPTSRMVRASWGYGQAKHAVEPTGDLPPVPDRFDRLAVLPPRQGLIVELGDRIPEKGTLRVRVLASAESPDANRIPELRLEFGWQASNDSQATVRISPRDIPVTARDEPQFYEWRIPISQIYPRNSVRGISKMGDLPSPSEYLRLVNAAASVGDIIVHYMEVTAPFYEQWPPASHVRLFGDQRPDDEVQAAGSILARFLHRAYRRPLTEADIEGKLRLFRSIRPRCATFEEAMVEVLAGALSSPHFLYLARSANDSDDQRLSQFELATRLSVFLWSSIPDDQLLRLAAENRLSKPEVLRSEVTRMLADSRAKRLPHHFVRQWLGMQLLDYLKVDRKLYPHYDPSLKEAMQREPAEFFGEMLRSNASIVDFLHADYTMANERLASHYGLKKVYGNRFRRVPIPSEYQRGGLLTQPGLLAMNSDGKDSHPLKRGIWLLENLLNDPPPPPPPAVPEIDLADPEIAKLTLKQRIEDHRNQPACMSCHAKIDPWGIAFENFDASGAWRTQIKGKPVDASSVLFNQQRLDGMDGLKRFLLANRQDQFARAVVHKLATYALGRPLTFADRADIDRITAELRKQGDGLATLVTLIVTSDLFQSR